MKRTVMLTLLAAAGSAAFAQMPPPGAPLPPSFVDQARVRSSEPQYEQVQTPRQDCTSQTVIEQRPIAQPGIGSNVGGTVLGAVVGGLIGNQVGRGHGREAATAAGAVAGAVVGNNVANGSQPQAYAEVPTQVQSCRTINEVENRLVGYRVTYEYRGHEYVTVLRDNPGPTVPVRVSVVPVEPEYHHRY